ncbi:hypothetical protein [Microbacterium binotii]|uniref:Uncharacterized protein n=1 Tax=Microbacterium binotii TaxID=462710 RepID=A0ABN3PD44_9MICO
MSKTQDAEFVRNDAIETILSAVEYGLLDGATYFMEGDVLRAETYGEDGEPEAQWVIEIVARPFEGSGS